MDAPGSAAEGLTKGEPPVVDSTCPAPVCTAHEEDGSGGASATEGSGGGERIGVAQEALAGCCCDVVVDGSPVKCLSVDDPSECKGQYFQGACNPVPGCSASGARSGAGGVNARDGFVLFLALAALRSMRRRFA